MKRILCFLLAIALFLPCAALGEAPFSYIYLDCRPFLTGVMESVPFVILTNRDAVAEKQDSFYQTLERLSSVYFWERWEKRYYQVMEPYREGVTGQAYYAAVIRDYNPATMSGTLAFGYHGMQELFYPLTCETYVLTSDDYYEYVAAMVDIAASDAMYDRNGNRIRSEKQIARNLHDWLCERMVYDESVTAGAGNTSLSFGEILYRGTGYGGLHHGGGKCTSYANAYQLLLRAAGIECFVLHGTANTGKATGGHSWNIARLDGQWVFIDVTWDDSARGYNHDYFAVSRSKMDRNHFLSSEAEAFVAYLTDGRFDRAVRVLGR